MNRMRDESIAVDQAEVLIGPEELEPPPSQRELSGRLAGLTLPRQVYVLAIWPFLEQLLNFSVGFVDTALAGRISVAATGAITVAAYMGWLMGLIQMAVGIGAGAVVARAIGGKHRRLANAALGQAILLAVATGLVMGALVWLIAPWAARLAGRDNEAIVFCTIYLRIIACAAPFSAVLFVSAACLRAAGDTRSPFFVLVLVNAVNVGVSITLVAAPPPWGGYGVAGIAAGTFVAWGIGALVILAVLVRTRGGIRLRLMRLRPRWHTMRRIIAVGVPSLVESGGLWTGNLLVLVVVWGLKDNAAIAAHGAVIRLEAISYLPGIAIATAAGVLTGQYLGLGDPQRARQAVRLCAIATMTIMGLLGVMFLTIPWYLSRAVTNQPELLAIMPKLLMICGAIQAPFGLYFVLSHALRGAGDTRAAMLMTLASTYGVRVPGSYIVGVVLGGGLAGVWFVLCGEWIVRAGLYLWRYLQGGWQRVRV